MCTFSFQFNIVKKRFEKKEEARFLARILPIIGKKVITAGRAYMFRIKMGNLGILLDYYQ